MTPRFDPTRAVVFDLARGQLRDEEGSSRLNLPFSVLARLCEHAGSDATADFAQSLGTELGRRVRDRLGNGADSADMEAWTEHLGGQLALMGLGNLQIERWGRALVLRLGDYPDGAASLLPSIVEGALRRATGRQLSIVAFEQGASLACLVVSAATAQRVQQLQSSGQGLGQIVEGLHEGAGGAA